MIPPKTRKSLSSAYSTASSYLSTGLVFSGKTLWVVSTSALLLGVPWALAFAEEQQMVEMEREMKMQQSGSEMLMGGGQGLGQGQGHGAKPAL